MELLKNCISRFLNQIQSHDRSIQPPVRKIGIRVNVIYWNKHYERANVHVAGAVESLICWWLKRTISKERFEWVTLWKQFFSLMRSSSLTQWFTDPVAVVVELTAHWRERVSMNNDLKSQSVCGTKLSYDFRRLGIFNLVTVAFQNYFGIAMNLL